MRETVLVHAVIREPEIEPVVPDNWNVTDRQLELLTILLPGSVMFAGAASVSGAARWFCLGFGLVACAVSLPLARWFAARVRPVAPEDDDQSEHGQEEQEDVCD
jgi:hypothetical protein